jgi:predicted ATP-dependent serine protease
VYKLKLLSVELDVAILAVAHLNREGKLRGSAQIEQLANICIRLERDKLSDDFKTKTTSKVIIFKNRFVSREGLVGLLTFNPTTNRLEEENGSSI